MKRSKPAVTISNAELVRAITAVSANSLTSTS
jgi:hypothetical protein